MSTAWRCFLFRKLPLHLDSTRLGKDVYDDLTYNWLRKHAAPSFWKPTPKDTCTKRHKTKRARKHGNPDSRTNRYPINKWWNATNLYSDDADDKIVFSLSLHISFVSDIHASLRDLIHTLGHTWVDSKRKEDVFNPILPAWWCCCGKLLFFCMRKIKVSGLILPLLVRIRVTHAPRAPDRWATSK